jgi:hypothetical protein
MVLTDARREARTAADGSIMPLAEQDRSRWSAEAIAGDHDAAYRSYLRAATMTASLPEQRYLVRRAARLPPRTKPAVWSQARSPVPSRPAPWCHRL